MSTNIDATGLKFCQKAFRRLRLQDLALAESGTAHFGPIEA